MILLDTHALIWWFEGSPKLSLAAKAAIENAQRLSRVTISSLSCWEIALLNAHGRIHLSTELHNWIKAIQKLRRVRFIPVDNHIAVASVELPGQFHKDPADRIIVATALTMNIPLVTIDQKIRAYPHVRTIW
ncbi:UNVERIFIED_ORG: PIN domain nuclease of toxin-antitoxin system [Zoogloea ramigera]|uniref:Type II toxin-antitoxin system VapC family toxin n=1 Tax=Duganella zoogloeoides TaxID=75659 RepID=A0ABZ0XYP7_9BURK|nr:type II toxin-antitoxin system VapC family toxin [Duganella zoogloeoides]WQH04860.1 type II toxin-antitoxin system VapC family toxin [Duganella zoogloeoides]